MSCVRTVERSQESGHTVIGDPQTKVRSKEMAAPDVVYCDVEKCIHNESGECTCEELRISDMKECDSCETGRN